jgi:hypothetical protein
MCLISPFQFADPIFHRLGWRQIAERRGAATPVVKHFYFYVVEQICCACSCLA